MILAAGDFLRQMPKVETPVLSIVITFSIFTVIILAAYIMLVRYERREEKRKVRANYEHTQDSNAYNEKFNFLYNQEVSATTL